MRGNLFDFVLLPLLILFFGVLQARRPLRRYRLWLGGWTLTLLSFLVWTWPLASPLATVVQESIRLDCLICGGLLFLASFVPRKISRIQLAMYVALLAVAPCVLADATAAGIFGPVFCCVVALLGELVALWLARSILAAWPGYRLIVAQCIVAAVALVVLSPMTRPDIMVTVILVQILWGCATLLLANTRNRNTGTWMTAAGFLAWGALYFTNRVVLYNPHAYLAFLDRIWNLPKYLVGFGMILSVVEESTEQIRTLSEEYRLLYESNPHPMWIYGMPDARFLSVNDAAVRVYGYTREELLSMTLFDIRPESDYDRLRAALKSEAKGRQQVWRHQRKDGSLFDVEITGHDVSFGGRSAGFSMAIDITERERMNRELVYNAQHDALTGLANRVLLDDRALQTLARSVRDHNKAALLTIDVDRFKRINDTYGHHVGDECLKAIAARLSTRVRDADTLARTGGEEFTLVVGGLTSRRGAAAAAAALLSTLEQPLTLSNNEIAISVSIGVALYPDDGEDLDAVRKRSDKALYQAKRAGGGRAVLASLSDDAEERNATDVEAALRRALADNTLLLEYQPIFDFAGKLVRVEALARGGTGTLSGSSPAEFVPVAEESGLILPLGTWVLDEACRQMAAWRALKLPPFQLAVNVSARQLVQDDFAEMVLRTLQLHDLPAQVLHLELTETTLMRDFSSMVRSMERLAEAGVFFSIDDFGTGYSSLARLSELPISTIKIDRSFVLKLTESEAAVGIVRAIVHMSRHLRLEVVAEGVEHADHIRTLLDLGCHMFQGFYLSRPLTPAALQAALTEGGEVFRASLDEFHFAVSD